MQNPLVTVSIPTYNSDGFITTCLQSIFNQSYKNIEINIIDRNSKDQTLKIVKKFGVRQIKIFKGPLLGARHLGIRIAKGKYVLFLDSDQVLSKDAILNSVKLMESGNYDMLVLEEDAYQTKTLTEKLLYLDKKLMHKIQDLSPFTGVLLPRFYKKSLLIQAFKNIPKEILDSLGGQDHAIIYYEAWLIGKRVGIVPQAVRHIEPDSLSKIYHKSYRWGYTSIAAHFGKYSGLVRKKERLRTGLFQKGLILESFASILVLLMKGIPYKLGCLIGTIDRKLDKTIK